jgi:Na+/proline symporter
MYTLIMSLRNLYLLQVIVPIVSTLVIAILNAEYFHYSEILSICTLFYIVFFSIIFSLLVKPPDTRHSFLSCAIQLVVCFIFAFVCNTKYHLLGDGSIIFFYGFIWIFTTAVALSIVIKRESYYKRIVNESTAQPNQVESNNQANINSLLYKEDRKMILYICSFFLGIFLIYYLLLIS